MSDRQIDPRIDEFIECLRKLDAGERAQLKRSAGQPLLEASGNALRLFYSLLPPAVPRYHEAAYFLLATLFSLADDGGSGNFGAALRRARRPDNAPGLDRRTVVLLDADESQLPFRLRQATRFLASNQVRVDWSQLLYDLLFWTQPTRFVQQNWARAYFAD